MVNIVLVDDHPIIRRGLRTLLEAQPGWKVVGETGNGFEAVQLIERLQPDVALLDLMIEGISGIEVAKRVNAGGAKAAIIIFSCHGSEHYILEAFRAGVKGYLLKESSSDEVLNAVREVVAGHRYLSLNVLDRTMDVLLKIAPSKTTDQLQSLSPREREVLYLSAQGKTSAEIGEKLFVSRRTVEAQRASMMRKLGLRNQQELICFAFQKGIIVSELTV